MPYRTIMLTKENGIATLTLNRPEVLNAMNNEMNQELRSALDEIKADAVARVLIITGAGEKAFSAGRDLKEYSGAKDHANRGMGREDGSQGHRRGGTGHGAGHRRH